VQVNPYILPTTTLVYFHGMKVVICWLLMLCTTTFAFGQLQSMPKLFEAEKMEIRGTRVFQNGKKIKLKDLEPFLNKYPDAAAEYRTFLRQRTNIRIFQGVSLLPSLMMMSSNQAVFWSGFGATTSFELVSIPLNRRARRHLIRSVQYYNERSLNEFLYK
jgi:hypothetical protein